MKKINVFIKALIVMIFPIIASCTSLKTENYDVIITGGGASGVSAALQIARMGKTVCVIEETNYLGGMLTAAGVSAVDGNYKLPAGIFGEFRSELANYYGSLEALQTGWVSLVLFEPSVGNQIFHEMVAEEKNITLLKNYRAIEAEKANGKWNVSAIPVKTDSLGIIHISQEKGKNVKLSSKILIDATELGDIAALCGVEYDLGMESRDETGEDMAPSKSNNIVQDMTWVAILKDYGDTRSDSHIIKEEPNGYNINNYKGCCINPLCDTPVEEGRIWSASKMIEYGHLPNNKYMINWPLMGNDYYANVVEMTPAEREEIYIKERDYTLGFIYFIQHELGFKNLGLADDEFEDCGYLAAIPYHRESRRIKGLVRFTVTDLVHPYDCGNDFYRTCIAVGDYPVDHHHSAYSRHETLPDLHFYPVPSFGLPLGTLIPKNVEGLIVAEKSISVSNIANGATRLQPVVVQIGQAAGALAALAVEQSVEPSEVPVRDVQDVILSSGGYLLPYLDVPVSDPMFKSLQRIGSTGILKGEGKSSGWENETWFHVNDSIKLSDLTTMFEYYPYAKKYFNSNTCFTFENVIKILNTMASEEKLRSCKDADCQSIMDYFDLYFSDEIVRNDESPISRGVFAVLLDSILDPFHNKPVDIQGHLI